MSIASKPGVTVWSDGANALVNAHRIRICRGPAQGDGLAAYYICWRGADTPSGNRIDQADIYAFGSGLVIGGCRNGCYGVWPLI